MSATVQFGMLQRLKTQDFKNNTQAQGLQTELKNQISIFDQAKEAYDKVNGQGEQGVQASTGAFTQPSMSVNELENTMNEEQEKLEKLMTALTQEAEKDNTPQGENEDDKNKVKPKQFGGMMA